MVRALTDPITLGSVTLGSSVTATSIHVLNDTTYVALASIGGFISVIGIIDRLKESGELESTHIWELFVDILKGFVLGSLFTIMSFMGLVKAGTSIIQSQFGVEVESVGLWGWFILSLLLSFYSISIIDWIAGKIKDKVSPPPPEIIHILEDELKHLKEENRILKAKFLELEKAEKEKEKEKGYTEEKELKKE
jgi:hypothetical protein